MTAIKFETRAVEDKRATAAEGHVVLRNEDWITFLIDDRTEVPMPIEQARSSSEWPNIEPKYAAWKANDEEPEDGFPLKSWPQVTEAEWQTLRRLHVTTVEALANAPDNVLDRYGPGARGLQEKARAWLRAATDTGKLAEQIRLMEGENISLKGQIAELQATVEALCEDSGDEAPKRGRRAA